MAEKSFNLVVTAACQNFNPIITLDPSTFTDQSYTLESSPVTLDVLSNIRTSQDLSTCGSYTVEFLYADGTALTTDTITYSDATGLSIETSDATKIGEHYLVLRVYLTNYPNFQSNTVPLTVTIAGIPCEIGTASFLPDFTYDSALGTSQTFSFAAFQDAEGCANTWTYAAYLVTNEADEASDVALPWGNLVLDGLVFTIADWDELELDPTMIRVVGTVDGIGSVSFLFTIYTAEVTAEEETAAETETTDAATTTTNTDTAVSSVDGTETETESGETEITSFNFEGEQCLAGKSVDILGRVKLDQFGKI